jgi:hypothetical protein
MTKAKKLSIGLALIIICALVAAAVWKNWTQLGLAIGPSCGLKVNGTNSSIVIKGWTSPFVCSYLKNKYNTYLGPSSNNPTTQTVCVYKYDGDMIYIHDAGSLKIVGSLLCYGLHNLQHSST